MDVPNSEDRAISREPSGARAPSLEVVTPTLGSCAVQAGGLLGLEFYPITVEVAARRGPSYFQLAGLAETAVREARIRLQSALATMGITLDEYALTVNLAPAHLRKSGTGLDLAMAVGILGAIGWIEPTAIRGALFLGEISLEGRIRPVPGVLPLLLGAHLQGTRRVFVARDNAEEASQPEGLVVHPVRGLSQLVAHLQGKRPISAFDRVPAPPEPIRGPDLSEVRGQHAAKRALTIAAAGGHHILLIGPPGSGKSLLARRLPGLLPPLSHEEAIESTSIHSVAGLLKQGQGLLAQRPFRAPHHTVSEAGLIGGGSYPRPGEISLAHRGVLFLDELPEFRRSTLESLRQPLEEHEVTIVRSKMRATFPASPLLVCAMNPCPCGNWGSPQAPCRCDAKTRARYLQRISGPLLDRLDLHIVVPPVPLEALIFGGRVEKQDTAHARKNVASAREWQRKRKDQGSASASRNALLSLSELEKVTELDHEARQLLELAMSRGQLSARGYVRVLRVARTIADLDDSSGVTSTHLGEALRYRMSDLARI